MADVLPYDTTYPATKDVPIVSGATAWDNPSTGETMILIVHEGLYYGRHLDHSLVNPNQIRHHGNTYHDNPFDQTKELTIVTENMTIPLQAVGTKILWQSRAPTDGELRICPRVELTSDTHWDPETVVLAQTTTTPRIDKGTGDRAELNDAEPPEPYRELDAYGVRRLIESTSLQEDIPAKRTFLSTKRHTRITPEDLCERWSIGLNQARATIMATTQRGVRSAILRIRNVRRLDDHFATDTFFADVLSKTQNKCAQVFSTKAGFTAIYPMRDATAASIAQTLSDFIHDYGVPM